MEAARNDPATCKPYFDDVTTTCGSAVNATLVDCADVKVLLTTLCG